MGEARFLRGGIGMSRDHRRVPMVDRFGRMFRAVLFHPLENGLVVVQFVGGFFEPIGIQSQKSQEMFVEPNGFIVVSVEQSFAMQFCLVDQTGQMHVPSQLFVGTAWTQLLHRARPRSRALGAPRPRTRFPPEASGQGPIPATIPPAPTRKCRWLIGP